MLILPYRQNKQTPSHEKGLIQLLLYQPETWERALNVILGY
ncbi:MAG: hypothetical protein RLZZ04_1544 [Cyanobacteriota bacterium]